MKQLLRFFKAFRELEEINADLISNQLTKIEDIFLLKKENNEKTEVLRYVSTTYNIAQVKAILRKYR